MIVTTQVSADVRMDEDGLQTSYNLCWKGLRVRGFLLHGRMAPCLEIESKYNPKVNCIRPTEYLVITYNGKDSEKKNIYIHIHTHIYQFSCSAASDSWRPHALQHARLPCPSPSPRARSNSCPLSWCCHPTISSSAVPLSSRPQSFPASESFPVSQFFHQVAKGLEFQLQHQSF